MLSFVVFSANLNPPKINQFFPPYGGYFSATPLDCFQPCLALSFLNDALRERRVCNKGRSRRRELIKGGWAPN